MAQRLLTGMEAMIHSKSFISTSDLFITVYRRRFKRWFIAGSCCGPTNIFKVNRTKIIVYLDLSTIIDQKEVMIHFKSFISTSDLFIIVYRRHFEYWFIAGSCCGPANILKVNNTKIVV